MIDKTNNSGAIDTVSSNWINDVPIVSNQGHYTVSNVQNKITLYKKLRNVAEDAGWIEKENEVKFGSTRYSYTSEAQFLSVMRPLFNEYGLIIYPSGCTDLDIRVNEKGSYLTTFIMHYVIADTDTGEYIQVSIPAQGTDSGDKGAYKALTGAYKAALRQSFMVGTGADPEATDDTGKSVSNQAEVSKLQARQDYIKGMLKTLGFTKQRVEKVFPNDIPSDDNTLRQIYDLLKRQDKKSETFSIDEVEKKLMEIVT